MNYEKIYNSIINKALIQKLADGVYYEKHHILPRCLGGDNTAINLVYLTAREHFICHKLLYKMYVNTNHEAKLLHAFLGMCRKWQSKYNCKRYSKISSTQFAYIKNKLYGKNGLLKGKNSPIYGRTHTEESIELMREKVKLSWTSGTRKAILYRKPHSEEAKLKMSISGKNKRKGKDNPNAKKCYIEGIVYDSVADAGKVLDIKPNTIQYRIYSSSMKFKQYYYLLD